MERRHSLRTPLANARSLHAVAALRLGMYSRTEDLQEELSEQQPTEALKSREGVQKLEIQRLYSLRTVSKASRRSGRKEGNVSVLTLIMTVFLPSLLSDMVALTAHQSNSTELPIR